MRVQLAVLAGALLIVSPAFAGNITATNNQVNWQSTQCSAPPTAPVQGPAGTKRHPVTADDMNHRVTEYNQYVQQVQGYVDCVSKEAQTDATNVSQSITGSAQKSIDDERKSVSDIGAQLQQQQDAAANRK